MKNNKSNIVIPSYASVRMVNPIRSFVEQFNIVYDAENNYGRGLINLTLGDPTKFKQFRVPKGIEDELIKKIKTGQSNGYTNSAGSIAARMIVGKVFSVNEHPITSKDVILTSGCSSACQIAISSLLNEGDNLLIPKPGFSLYRTICENCGGDWRYYNLLPDKDWEIDLDDLEEKIDSRTKGILVNNPSNPCGSVFTKKHMKDILSIAEKYNLPIICDEIYHEMVFEGTEYYPFSEVSEKVPIISLGGISKRYMCPGWRLGWILLHDRQDRLGEYRIGVFNSTQLILGPNTLIQSCIPQILMGTPDSFYESTNKLLGAQAKLFYDQLSSIYGLNPVLPRGAMYLMFELDFDLFDFDTDLQFVEKLYFEQGVFALPGYIFEAKGFIRVVICAPIRVLTDAAERIKKFCEMHKIDSD